MGGLWNLYVIWGFIVIVDHVLSSSFLLQVSDDENDEVVFRCSSLQSLNDYWQIPVSFNLSC